MERRAQPDLRDRNGTTTLDRNFKPEEKAELLKKLGYECVYCGKGGELNREHLVPQWRWDGRDNADRLHNEALACDPCNNGKAGSDLTTWYRVQRFYDPDKEKRLLDWMREDTTVYGEYEKYHKAFTEMPELGGRGQRDQTQVILEEWKMLEGQLWAEQPRLEKEHLELQARWQQAHRKQKSLESPPQKQVSLRLKVQQQPERPEKARQKQALLRSKVQQQQKRLDKVRLEKEHLEELRQRQQHEMHKLRSFIKKVDDETALKIESQASIPRPDIPTSRNGRASGTALGPPAVHLTRENFFAPHQQAQLQRRGNQTIFLGFKSQDSTLIESIASTGVYTCQSQRARIENALELVIKRNSEANSYENLSVLVNKLYPNMEPREIQEGMKDLTSRYELRCKIVDHFFSTKALKQARRPPSFQQPTQPAQRGAPAPAKPLSPDAPAFIPQSSTPPVHQQPVWPAQEVKTSGVSRPAKPLSKDAPAFIPRSSIHPVETMKNPLAQMLAAAQKALSNAFVGTAFAAEIQSVEGEIQKAARISGEYNKFAINIGEFILEEMAGDLADAFAIARLVTAHPAVRLLDTMEKMISDVGMPKLKSIDMTKALEKAAEIANNPAIAAARKNANPANMFVHLFPGIVKSLMAKMSPDNAFAGEGNDLWLDDFICDVVNDIIVPMFSGDPNNADFNLLMEQVIKRIEESGILETLSAVDQAYFGFGADIASIIMELFEIQGTLFDVYKEVIIDELKAMYPGVAKAVDLSKLFLGDVTKLFDSGEVEELLMMIPEVFARNFVGGFLTQDPEKMDIIGMIPEKIRDIFELIRSLIMLTDQVLYSLGYLDGENSGGNRLARFLYDFINGQADLGEVTMGVGTFAIKSVSGSMRKMLGRLDDPVGAMKEAYGISKSVSSTANAFNPSMMAAKYALGKAGQMFGFDANGIANKPQELMDSAVGVGFDAMERASDIGRYGLDELAKKDPTLRATLDAAGLLIDTLGAGAGAAINLGEKYGIRALKIGAGAIGVGSSLINGDFEGAWAGIVDFSVNTPMKVLSLGSDLGGDIVNFFGGLFDDKPCSVVIKIPQDNMRLSSVKFGGGVFKYKGKDHYHLTGTHEICPDGGNECRVYGVDDYVPADSPQHTLNLEVDQGSLVPGRCQDNQYMKIGAGNGPLWFGWGIDDFIYYKKAIVGEDDGTWRRYEAESGKRDIKDIVSGKDGKIWILDGESRILQYRSPDGKNERRQDEGYVWRWNTFKDPRASQAEGSPIKEIFPIDGARMVMVTEENQMYYSESADMGWQKISLNYLAFGKQGLQPFVPVAFDLFYGPDDDIYAAVADTSGALYFASFSGGEIIPAWLFVLAPDTGLYDFDFSDDGKRLAIIGHDRSPSLFPVNEAIWSETKNLWAETLRNHVFELHRAGDDHGLDALFGSDWRTHAALPPVIPVQSLSGKASLISPDPMMSWKPAAQDKKTMFYRVRVGNLPYTFTENTSLSLPMSYFNDGPIHAEVQGLDMQGNQSKFVSLGTVIKDTIPPNLVVGLEGVPVKKDSVFYNSIRLSWDATADYGDDLDQWNVYRVEADQNGAPGLGSASGMTPVAVFSDSSRHSYMDQSVTPGQGYRYAVAGVDDVGNVNESVWFSERLVVNSAPVFSAASSPTPLISIHEDQRDGSGDSVAALVENRVEDLDGVLEAGIAVTSADHANGRWESVCESQNRWVEWVGLSNRNALLLDSSCRMRFVPRDDWHGEARFVFQAWDKSSGASGHRGDAREKGDYHAFSDRSVEAVIAVKPVNDAPSFTLGAAPLEINEGAGFQTIPNWAEGIRKGPDNESGQRLEFTLTHDRPVSPDPANRPELSYFHSAPAIDPNTGTLTFQVSPHFNGDAHGNANIVVRLKDDGGIENGGLDQDQNDPAAEFSIAIYLINDAPSFVPVAQVVDEDSGTQRVLFEDWAHDVCPGPDDESGQTLTFAMVSVVSENPSLFSEAPALSADKTLSFAPAPDQFGEAQVVVKIIDDGGVQRGGVDRAEFTLDITVNPVNDAPSFAPADQVVNEDSGAQSLALAKWAGRVDFGADNETDQTARFSIVSVDPAGLFSQGPGISEAGVLTFAPAKDQFGTARVKVSVADGGETERGGVNSAESTFDITVRPVNDPPSFVSGSRRLTVDSGADYQGKWVQRISVGPANEKDQSFGFAVQTNKMSLFSRPPAIDRNGMLTFSVKPGAAGLVNIAARIKDGGGIADGGRNQSGARLLDLTIEKTASPEKSAASGAEARP